MITSNSQPINANSIWDKVGIPCRGIALHAAINSGFSYRIFSTIAEFMGMENKELASSLSISVRTLNRRAKDGRFTSFESDKLYRFTDVLVWVIDYFDGNRDKAITWLTSSIKGLGNKKPVDMLSTHAGSDAVKDIIGRLDHGIFV